MNKERIEAQVSYLMNMYPTLDRLMVETLLLATEEERQAFLNSEEKNVVEEVSKDGENYH